MIEPSQLKVDQKTACYHCGDPCVTACVEFDDKNFCCEGCKLVYELLKENSLCTYYQLNESPGTMRAANTYTGKFDYLNNPSVFNQLVSFTDETLTHVTFFVPKIHCSSCIWLLENLQRLNAGIISSQVNFLRKEVVVAFRHQEIQLSKVAEIMSNIGYEPLINLNSLEKPDGGSVNRTRILKIGIAGFCFGNIMMLSFPEYFSFGNLSEVSGLSRFFSYLNLSLSLPVFFYSASEFFESAWTSIKHRFLNIDAPIALAILVTFGRSVYEILSHTGAGYLDSMSGIVFFMLIGRYFQNKTYETLSFERDYKSYFPIGITRLDERGTQQNIPVTDLKAGDKILVRNQELIPADATLTSRSTHVDYSFITGESNPVKKMKGDLIYAGARQLDGAITLEVTNTTSQSYLTQLWNQQDDNPTAKKQQSYIDNINKYFTLAVLSTSFLAGLFWLLNDPGKALNAATAVLIVACPCGLLLISTFANGNVLRIFGRRHFYLKNAATIENLAKTDTLIFDKTGTITHGSTARFIGHELTEPEIRLVAIAATQSNHPLSRIIAAQYGSDLKNIQPTHFEEFTGLGIRAEIDRSTVIMGSEFFVTGHQGSENAQFARVFVMIDGQIMGFFAFANTYREGLGKLCDTLKTNYQLNLLSGDNAAEENTVRKWFGPEAHLLFNQKPDEKMDFVREQQLTGRSVTMIGDGLNDAGALKLSNVGIAVSDDTNTFSPACDALLNGNSLSLLAKFMQLAKDSQRVVVVVFAVSLIYNVIGVGFSVQGILSPVIAAILMPISSITIVLLATGLTSLAAKIRGI